MGKQIVRLVSVIDVDVSGLDELYPEELELEEPHREDLDYLYSLQSHSTAVRKIGEISGMEVVNERDEADWMIPPPLASIPW